MARPRRYPPAVAEAIWAAMRTGKKTKQIMEMLHADQLGIGRPIPMPKRTVQEYANRLRRERGEPDLVVDSLEQTASVAEEIRLAFLTDLRATQRHLTKKRKREGRLNAADLTSLERCARALGDIERAVIGPSEAKPRSRSKSATNPKSGTLSDLARQRQERERQSDETRGPASPLDPTTLNGDDSAYEVGDAGNDGDNDDSARSAESALAASLPSVPAAA